MHNLKSNYIKHSPETRLYNTTLPIIGLTGGIATGKSSTTKILKDMGVPIIDADLLVKAIYAELKTISFIQDLVPDTVNESTINFQRLREHFFNDKNIKAQIEKFIYNELPEQFISTVDSFKGSDFNYLVYDVPLLFEKNINQKVDINILVYCTRQTQKQRLIERDLISPELAEKILSQQMDIEHKRGKSEFVISNEGTKDQLRLNTLNLLKSITATTQRTVK